MCIRDSDDLAVDELDVILLGQDARLDHPRVLVHCEQAPRSLDLDRHGDSIVAMPSARLSRRISPETIGAPAARLGSRRQPVSRASVQDRSRLTGVAGWGRIGAARTPTRPHRAGRSLCARGTPEHKGSAAPHRKDDIVTAHIAEATVRVDCGISPGPIRRIWTSFGYDEINWTCTPAGKRALKVIGQFVEQPYYVRSHYIFNSGIGWSLPHWGAGNVYHEVAAGRPFYDFTIADQVYDAVVEAGLRPLVELAFTPRALVPDDAEQRFRYEPSPTQWSPYEAGLWSFPPKDYGKWTGLVRALVEHCVTRYGATHVRGWLWELWNEPDISYWRGTPEEFYALYDVTAAAVKAALPDAAVTS